MGRPLGQLFTTGRTYYFHLSLLFLATPHPDEAKKIQAHQHLVFTPSRSQLFVTG
jgi:hypothetical protein